MNADSANAHSPNQRLFNALRLLLQLTAILIAAPMLTACLDDSKNRDGGNGQHIGQVTLTGVEGLSYQTESITGTTDSKGRFQYLPGQTIRFSLGDLLLGEAIPAREFLTPLEFTADQRAFLNNGGTEDTGLTSHRVIEEFLATNSPEAVNITRFLMVLDQNQDATSGKPVQITQRTIDQINHYLSQTPDFTLDFKESPGNFSRVPNKDDWDEALSDANRLLQSICFHPANDPLCEEPPSQEEIDQLAPEDLDDKGSAEYQALLAKKEAIEAAKREIRDVDLEEVRKFLLEQTDQYKLKLERPYTLSPDTLTLRPGDTGLKEVAVLKIGGDLKLANLEVESKNPNTVIVHGYSAQTGVASFFLSNQASHNDEATLLVNYKLSGDYRWYRKSLLVRVDDNAFVQP